MPKFLDVPQWYGTDGTIKQGLGREELCLCLSSLETRANSSLKINLKIFFLASPSFIDKMVAEEKYYSLLGKVELPAVGVIIHPLDNIATNAVSVNFLSGGVIRCTGVYFADSKIKSMAVQAASSDFYSESHLTKNIETISFYG